MAKGVVKPMTHEERQELIRRPIVFNYIGKKTSGGVASQYSLIPLSHGSIDYQYESYDE